MRNNYQFMGMVSEDGVLSILNAEDGTTVLTLNFNGRLTLIGPDEKVLRTYEEEEVARRQKEMDEEVVTTINSAYDSQDYGEAVIAAFASAGDALESAFADNN